MRKGVEAFAPALSPAPKSSTISVPLVSIANSRFVQTRLPKRQLMTLHSTSCKCWSINASVMAIIVLFLLFGSTAAYSNKSALVLKTVDITQSHSKMDNHRIYDAHGVQEASTLEIFSTASIQHPFFTNPFDGSCSQTGNIIKVNPIPLSQNEAKGEICTKQCSSNADCDSFTDPYSNALVSATCVEHDPSAPAPVPSSSTPPSTAITHYCLPVANGVYTSDVSTPQIICPGGMTPKSKAGSPTVTYCLFTMATRTFEDFSLPKDKSSNGAWRVLATLPKRLNSPYARKTSSNTMLAKACVTTTSGGTPSLCPHGTFCLNDACAPLPYNSICLENGGSVGFVSPRLSSSQPICTLVDSSKVCGGEFEPFVNTLITSAITWFLFFLQVHLSQISCSKFFCSCCLRSRSSAVDPDAGASLLPIERITNSFLSTDMRFQNALNFVRTPFLSLMVLRTLWSIIAMWSAIFAKTGCIDSFGAFYYVVLNQEMAKQTIANSVILYNIIAARPKLFGSPIGITVINMRNPSCFSFFGFLLSNCMLLAASANMAVYTLAFLVFQWPYLYLSIGIALVQAILVYSFFNFIPNCMFSPTSDRFNYEISRLVGVAATGQPLITPNIYTQNIRKAQRTLSEIVVFAKVYILYYAFQKYLWSQGDDTEEQGEYERVKDRASDQTKIQILLKRIGSAIDKFSDQFEVPPILPPAVINDLSSITIKSLREDDDLYLNSLDNLFKNREAEIKEYIEFSSLPSLKDEAPQDTESNSVQLKGTQSKSAFLKMIDDDIINELLQSKDPELIAKVQTYRYSIHEIVSSNHHLVHSLQQEHSELPLSTTLEELTIDQDGVDVELRKMILTMWFQNGRLNRDDYASLAQIRKNRQARNNVTLSHFESLVALNQRMTQSAPKLLALFYQFLTWVLVMGCNYYFYTSYKDGFDITRDRVSMAEFYAGSVALKWYNYFF